MPWLLIQYSGKVAWVLSSIGIITDIWLIILIVSSSSRCGTVQVFSVDDFEKSHTVEYNNLADSWIFTLK